MLAGCGGPGRVLPAASRKERTQQAVERGARWLCKNQSEDGAWRSDVYATFKDGPALTPLALLALRDLPVTESIELARTKGIAYLTELIRSKGNVGGERGLGYPVYTAALTVQVMESGPARMLWTSYLRQRQLTEDLGWQPEDREYGGWGYSSILPRKGAATGVVPQLIESNLSATVHALDAIQTVGKAEDEPLLRKARMFVERCQNFGDDPKFDDGGFYFIYADPVRNKAGVAGKDAQGRERFTSYGSATADGLRALLACGTPADHARVSAARRWLEKNFHADAHPGAYSRDRSQNQPAVYYYYCYSLARSLQVLGKANRADALADALLKKQRDDGSWINSATAVREDDPIVATSLALAALNLCRDNFGR